MKNVLCKIGIHKPVKYRYLLVRKRIGKHKWHTNYIFCSRRGKRLRRFSVEKQFHCNR